jgi:hypothetical protein
MGNTKPRRGVILFNGAIVDKCGRTVFYFSSRFLFGIEEDHVSGIPVSEGHQDSVLSRSRCGELHRLS